MSKHSPPRLLSYVTLLVLVLLTAAYIAHARHMSVALLRTDPDLIPTNQDLMRYAVARGDSAYRAHCRACHRENGSGDPSRGIPVLSDADWLYGSGMVSDIERIVTYGIRSDDPKAWNLAIMPAFARPRPSEKNSAIVPLSPPQISDVIEFLRQAQHKPASADAVERGALVYQGIGGCYDCHSPDAKGDDAIGAPNLADNVTLYGNGDRDALYESIAYGRQGMCPSWIKVLSPLTIRELALYVYQLSHSTRLKPRASL